MELKKVRTEELRPNEYNPNKMSGAKYEVMKSNIAEEGMLQPLLVNEDMTIIDGYHRWKACKELGIEEVWAVIISDGEERAKLKTLAMNKIRGKNNPVLFADLLKSLLEQDEFDEEFISVNTGIDVSDINDIIKLSELDDNFDFDDFFNDDEEESVRISEILGKSKLPARIGRVIADGIEVLDAMGYELEAWQIMYLYLKLYLEELEA